MDVLKGKVSTVHGMVVSIMMIVMKLISNKIESWPEISQEKETRHLYASEVSKNVLSRNLSN